jgi:hypothetical protein
MAIESMHALMRLEGNVNPCLEALQQSPETLPIQKWIMAQKAISKFDYSRTFL